MIICTVPQLFAGTGFMESLSANNKIDASSFSSEQGFDITPFYTNDHFDLLAIEIDEEDKDFLCSLKKYLKNRSFELSYSLLLEDSSENYPLIENEDISTLAELPLFLEFSDLRI